jgi:hypothetical protein
MSSMLLLLLLVAAVIAVLYFFVFFNEVPEVARERLGELEALPEAVGQWQVDESSEAARAARTAGLIREQRLCHDPRGGFGGGRLLRQVRYRSAQSGEVVRVEPDQVVKRRRIRG